MVDFSTVVSIIRGVLIFLAGYQGFVIVKQLVCHNKCELSKGKETASSFHSLLLFSFYCAHVQYKSSCFWQLS